MKTVLIVDDLESVRFYHERLLRQAGFATVVARDGLEALTLLQGCAVDLIMLDLMMPRMSGEEFLARAVDTQNSGTVPVLVISSERSALPVQPLRNCSRCEVLQKPILPGDLLAAVHRLLA